MKWNFLLILSFSFCLLARPTLADNKCEVGIVYSAISAVKAAQLKQNLSSLTNHGIRLSDVPLANKEPLSTDYCAVITTDPIAWEQATLSLPSIPAIATFITENSYHAIQHKGPSTGIYYDSDPNQVIQLLDDLVGRPKHIVFLGKPATLLKLEQIGKNHVDILETESVSEFFRFLHRNSHVDYFVATPGFAPLNSKTFEAVLDLLHSRSQGLIGYTEAMTRSGALLSVYPLEEDIAKKTKIALLLFQQTGKFPGPVVVESFQWSKNNWIAASLNLVRDHQTAMPETELTAYNLSHGAKHDPIRQ